MSCKGCKRLTRTGYCKVMKEKLNRCWAWTNDPEWADKAREEVKKYKAFKNGEITQYWG